MSSDQGVSGISCDPGEVPMLPSKPRKPRRRRKPRCWLCGRACAPGRAICSKCGLIYGPALDDR
jgi:hypothetical protein